MSGRVSVCSICPKENEQIDAVIRISKEKRSVLYGRVVDECGRPVSDAVVKLLKVDEKCGKIEPLTHTFTDRFGQFLLGPLCPCQKYILKVYKDNVLRSYESLNESCNDSNWCIGRDRRCDERDTNRCDRCDCCR